MAFRKLTKHVIFGSTLIGHFGHDLSDFSSSSASWQNWGESTKYTPQYEDSHLEITCTGSANNTQSNTGTGRKNAGLRILVNGNQQYIQEGAIGISATQSGTHFYYNPRYNQHNARQEFHASNFSTAIYAHCAFTAGTINEQEIRMQVYSYSSHNINWRDGYLTVTELSGPGHNLT